MCWMMAAQMGVQAGQNIMGSYALMDQGKAAYKEAKYQAAISRNNAMVAGVGARDAQQRGNNQEVEYAQQLEQFKGRQRVAFASNGIVSGEGSALKEIADTAMIGHFNAETIRRNTERETLGFLNTRNQFLHDAKMTLARGKHEAKKGKRALMMTLLDPYGDFTKPLFTGQAQDKSHIADPFFGFAAMGGGGGRGNAPAVGGAYGPRGGG